MHGCQIAFKARLIATTIKAQLAANRHNLTTHGALPRLLRGSVIVVVEIVFHGCNFPFQVKGKGLSVPLGGADVSKYSDYLHHVNTFLCTICYFFLIQALMVRNLLTVHGF